jgi:hypothetical protein
MQSTSSILHNEKIATNHNHLKRGVFHATHFSKSTKTFAFSRESPNFRKCTTNNAHETDMIPLRPLQQDVELDNMTIDANSKGDKPK